MIGSKRTDEARTDSGDIRSQYRFDHLAEGRSQMSESGQKRKSSVGHGMSAFGGRADVVRKKADTQGGLR